MSQEKPYGTSSTQLTGTITTTGHYQLVFPAASNGAVVGRLVQNRGVNQMLLFFGATKPANSANVGFPLAGAAVAGGPGGWMSNGGIGGGQATDAQWITGTAGDLFEYLTQP